jgi:hypothetical protein
VLKIQNIFKMPRMNFKPSKKMTKYSEEQMQLAIKDVNRNTYSLNQAAKLYGIPKTTLFDRVNNRYDRPGTGSGATSWLPEEFESLLVDALIKLAEWGYGLNFSGVKMIVRSFLKNTEFKHLFKNGIPGVDWYRHFMHRHRTQISERKVQNLASNRAYSCTPDIIDDFFTLLSKQFDSSNFEMAHLIWNVDESGFSCDPGNDKIICPRGSKDVKKLVGNNEKAMYTVASCCSAAGEFLPPFFVYGSTNIYNTWCQGAPQGTGFATSKSGWMEAEQFLQWFKQVFVPFVAKYNGSKTLIYDGHNSHISVDLIEYAIKHHIKLICLPPHSSHILQPLDVGVFGPVKSEWRRILSEYYLKTKFQNVDITKFPALFSQLFEKAFSRKNAIAGFEKTGIFPLNRQKIRNDQLKVSQTFQEQPEKSNQIQTRKKKMTYAKASQYLQSALLSHFQISNSNTTQPKKKIKRTNGEVLTENDVLERLREEEKQKKQKIADRINQIEERKRATEAKKIAAEQKRKAIDEKRKKGSRSCKTEKKSC